MKRLTHLDAQGRARMVDVSKKTVTDRRARAEAVVQLSRDAYAAVAAGNAPKGDVLAAARLAGIMAAKRTAELIPLCHQIPLSSVAIDFAPDDAAHSIRIRAEARTAARTGVEMEALVAASAAALTIYDMVKALDRAAEISRVRLLEKSGGKSGAYRAERRPAPKRPPRAR